MWCDELQRAVQHYETSQCEELIKTCKKQEKIGKKPKKQKKKKIHQVPHGTWC